ncbi:MAG: hypothetical protein H6697_07370 [Myxococcales bacterium]|nr:hypothetical protein [Myxococcales bacterium]
MFGWLAFCSLYLFADYTIPLPEGCHTGGAALEIMRFGFRFPLISYTPEYYENGIIVEALLAIPFFSLFGANTLSLLLLAISVSTALALAALYVLDAMLAERGVTAAWARVSAGVVLAVMLGFGPPEFQLYSASPLGDHHEGTMLNVVVLALLAARIRRPTRLRSAALWLAAGVAVFWEKGALMAAAVAALYEVCGSPLAVGRVRRWGLSGALFMVGFAPAVFLDLKRPPFYAAWLADKFGSEGESFLGGAAVWAALGWNPWLAALLAGSVAWLAYDTARHRRRESLVGYLLAYEALHIVLASLAGDYWVYSYPVVCLPVALGAGWVAQRMIRSAHRAVLAPAWTVLATCALAFVLQPAFTPNPHRIAEAREDTGRAACFWRFGRAFELTTDTVEEAVAQCRVLGPVHSLACVSGLGRKLGPELPVALTDAEQDAVAFGAGRHFDDRHPVDSAMTPRRQALLNQGQLLRCVAYADAISVLMKHRLLGRLECSVAPTGFDRYFDALLADLATRPPRATAPDVVGLLGPGCEPVLQQCFGEKPPTTAPGLAWAGDPGRAVADLLFRWSTR